MRIVADELEEEWNLVKFAFRADAFNERVLNIVDLRLFERGVIDKDLDGIRAEVFDALHRKMRQQVRQAARLGIVVPALLICE